MKTSIFLVVLLSIQAYTLHAQNPISIDTNQTIVDSFYNHLDEIQITATRAAETTPTTFTNLNKTAIQAENFGQDVPYLLNQTLSTATTSDAGANIGYSGIRIRGVDGTGINVTINGIPINDAESHNLYWVNMPDLASSMENVQIQRGVGTSANGGAAFGASINIQLNTIKQKAYAEIDNSFGSFKSIKNTISLGTGLIKNKFAFDARLSNIISDGYIDRAHTNLKSYYLSGAWLMSQKSVLKFNIFGGKEKTYQAWNGVPESRIKNDEQGMLDYAERNYLSEEQTENLLNSGRTYNYFTYKNQNDNYAQTHYQLHFNHQFNSKTKLNISAHYTKGKGYFEEYHYNQNLEDYSISPIIINDSTTISTSDLIRQKWLDNHFYGMIYNLSYSKNQLEIIYGGGINHYIGKHYGKVIWARYASNSEIEHTYYNDQSSKIDLNNFIKLNYRWKNNVFFADAQLRYMHYQFNGISDVSDTVVTPKQKVNYVYLNPKIGWMYRWTNNDLYLSFALAHREPIREDFAVTDNNTPKSEELYNIELGNRFLKGKWQFDAAYYLMYYRNQLIMSGKINNVGNYIRINVPKSYRTGFEFSINYKATKWLSIYADANFSINKLIQFTEYIDDYDNGGQMAIEHQHKNLAFSPNTIVAYGFDIVPVKNFNINWNGKYIGKQYLDNTQDQTKILKGYFVSNLSLNYALKIPKINGIDFGLQINNLFNKKYESNGYTFSYSYNHQIVKENFYFPQADINVMGRICIKI